MSHDSAGGFFHLAQCFWDLFVLWHVSLVCSFLLLSGIAWYEGTYGCWSTHLSRDILTVSMFGWLWIMLLKVFTERSLCVYTFSCFSWTGTWEWRCKAVWHAQLLGSWQTVFRGRGVCIILHFCQQRGRVLAPPHPCQHLLLSVFSI